MAGMSQTILLRPVPDFDAARKQKNGYREYPLNTAGERNSEPMVDIAQYGIAGQSYYSRPNGATGDPLPGVAPEVFVRHSVAERLATINYALQQSDEVAHVLDGRHVELYVDEGWRSLAVQRKLYEETFPAFIAKQHPQWTAVQVLARRNELIAEPSDEPSLPSPHVTGAAVDLKLRFVHNDLGFVPNSMVPMSNQPVSTSDTTNPDYYEHKKPLTKNDGIMRRNRRVFYWVMRGALIGDDPGFAVNPTEWWHWSYGDQLWATLTTAPQAFFGIPPE